MRSQPIGRGGGLVAGARASSSSASASPRALRPLRRAAATLPRRTSASAAAGADRSHEADVVVIGSGIGGLSCAALLARYGLDVTVCESHSVAGGAAHTFNRRGYHFESGPSLYSGMDGRGQAANPLAHVLQAIEEPLPLIKYDTWNVIAPEGEFLTRVGGQAFFEVRGGSFSELMGRKGAERRRRYLS